MKYCKKCLFPSTKPDLVFDKNGVCDACHSAKRKHDLEGNGIDWSVRKQEFVEILDKYSSKNGSTYDCIVPVSGGKDSLFQVHSMIKDYQMKPLAITFDQFDQTQCGRENLDILKSVGADHLHFTLNPKVISRLVHKGFEIVGDPYWVNHVGIYTVPVNLAVALNIPLIIQGENPQLEYGGPASSRDNFVLDKRWRQEFGLMRGFREEDMVDEEISLSDLKMLMWPSDEKIQSVGVTTLFYGYFHKWSTPGNVTVSESYGWKAMEEAWPGSWLNYENVDMEFIDIREHLKWLKFGYGRTTDQVNIHIRQGLLSREEGKKIVQERDGQYSEEHMQKFCKFIGITEQEFDRIRDTFANTDIFEKVGGQWQLKELAGEELELLKAS